MALRQWEAIQGRQLDICRANIGLLHQFFGRWGAVLRWQMPRAGTMCFPQLLTREPVDAFCERLVEETGVLVMPSTVYGHPSSVDQGRLRVGFGRRNMPACLERLDAFLLEHYP